MAEKEARKNRIELPEDAFPDDSTRRLLSSLKPRDLDSLDTGEDPMKIFVHGPGYSNHSAAENTDRPNTPNPPHITKTTNTPNPPKPTKPTETTKISRVDLGALPFLGKEQTLYEFLYTLTLGNGAPPGRYCRVSNQILMERCCISKITLPRCKRRLEQQRLVHEVVVRGYQGGNFYLIFFPGEEEVHTETSRRLGDISPYQDPETTEEQILDALASQFNEVSRFDPGLVHQEK